MANISKSVHALGLLGVLSLLLLYSINSAFGQTLQLLPPLSSSVQVLSTTNNPNTNQTYPLGIAGYNPSGATPAWDIAQWGRSPLLYPGAGSSSGWLNANSTAAIQYYQSINGFNNVYQLTQGGNICNNEFDLFLQPSSPISPSNYFTSLSSLFLDIGVHQVYTGGVNGANSTCANNYSQYTFAVILQTTPLSINSTTPVQTLFYQINVGSTDPTTSTLNSPAPSQVFDFNRNVAWCPEYEMYNDGGRQNAFCLDDDVRNFGGIFSNQNTNVLNNVELLPRLMQVISKTPYHVKAAHPGVQLISDPAQWRLVGVYYGNITQGGSVGAARWYGQSMRSTNGGSFCSNTKRIQWSCNGVPPGAGWNYVGGSCYHRNSDVSC